MKRCLKIIICLLFVSCINVNAASFSMNLSSNTTSVKRGEEVRVFISLNNIKDIPNGLNACLASLSSSNISINSVSANSSIGWGAVFENRLIMDSSISVKTSATLATIKATVNGNGSITISNIECSDGENDYKALSNTINFTLKEEKTTTTTKPVKTTTKKVEVPKTTTIQKNSSLLKSLDINEIELEFNRNTYMYKVEVDNSVDKINLMYETLDKNATVEKIGNDKLIVGENKIELVVTNQDSKSTYTLILVRKDVKSYVENNEIEILDALRQDIELLNVKVDINDSNKVITSNILKYIKENNKNIIYQVYDSDKIIYTIKINGNKLTSEKEIDFSIDFTSDYKDDIQILLSGKDYKIINFRVNEILNDGVEITIFNVGNNKYLYYFNQNKKELEFVSEYNIVNNNIKLDVENGATYVLISEKIDSNNIIFIFIISVIILIIILIVVIFIRNNFLKKQRNSNNSNKDVIATLNI